MAALAPKRIQHRSIGASRALGREVAGGHGAECSSGGEAGRGEQPACCGGEPECQAPALAHTAHFSRKAGMRVLPVCCSSSRLLTHLSGTIGPLPTAPARCRPAVAKGGPPSAPRLPCGVPAGTGAPSLFAAPLLGGAAAAPRGGRGGGGVRPTPSPLQHQGTGGAAGRHPAFPGSLSPCAPRCALVSTMATSDSAREPPAVALGPIPDPPKFKVALCQLAVTSDKARNIAHARKVIEKAADDGAKLVLLPEMWNCPYSNDSFPTFAEELDQPDFAASPSAAMLASVAQSRGITLVGGSIPERRGSKLYNTSLVFGGDGGLKGKFSKVHLFDIDIPGKMTFKESLTLTPGDELLVVDTEVGRLGVAICYDIRFPELAMLYAARGVHMLCYPGAFNMTTGPLHWELLQRARAADNQVFVATCSPARDDAASYRAWGHSTLVGPFGEVLATTGHEEAMVIAEVDLSEIAQRRQSVPFTTQRRGDLYTLVDKSRA